jgi:hypothetical protein
LGSSDPALSGSYIQLSAIPEVAVECEQDEAFPAVPYSVVVGSLICRGFVTVTQTFVDRVTTYLKLFKKQSFSSTALISEEKTVFTANEKYFKNIRAKWKNHGHQFPSIDECAKSSVGILFGLVWDTEDPDTVWSRSGSAIPEQPSVCGPGVSIPAPPPAPLLLNSLAILAEAASCDNALLSEDHQDDQDDQDDKDDKDDKEDQAFPALVDLHEQIQANSAFFSTLAAQAAAAHRDYYELQAAAIDHWNIANAMGGKAYDALCAAMKLSDELHIVGAHHFELTQKYEGYSNKFRKRCRDDDRI